MSPSTPQDVPLCHLQARRTQLQHLVPTAFTENLVIHHVHEVSELAPQRLIWPVAVSA